MREMIPILAVMGLTVAAVFLAFALVRSFFDTRRRKWIERTMGDDGSAGYLVLKESPEPRTAAEEVDRGFEKLVEGTGTGMTTAQGLGIIVLGGVVGAAIPLLLRGDLVLTIAGLLAGILLPLAYLYIQRSRYRNQVQEQLPDAFFLMSRSLRAGLNLEQSMKTVAEYGTQPLSGEFRRVGEQADLGLSIPVALKGMARRLDLTDFNMLVTAVTLHRTVGGNLALLLEKVATAVRDRNNFRGYFKAATALGRITGIAIALAPIILLIGYAIWQPEFLARFTSTPAGIRALTIAGILEVIGAIWMFMLLRVDY